MLCGTAGHGEARAGRRTQCHTNHPGSRCPAQRHPGVVPAPSLPSSSGGGSPAGPQPLPAAPAGLRDFSERGEHGASRPLPTPPSVLLAARLLCPSVLPAAWVNPPCSRGVLAPPPGSVPFPCGEHPHPGVLLHKRVRTQPVPHSLRATPRPPLHQAPTPCGWCTGTKTTRSPPLAAARTRDAAAPGAALLHGHPGTPRHRGCCGSPALPGPSSSCWRRWALGHCGGEGSKSGGAGKPCGLSCRVPAGDAAAASSEFPCTGDVRV